MKRYEIFTALSRTEDVCPFCNGEKSSYVDKYSMELSAWESRKCTSCKNIFVNTFLKDEGDLLFDTHNPNHISEYESSRGEFLITPKGKKKPYKTSYLEATHYSQKEKNLITIIDIKKNLEYQGNNEWTNIKEDRFLEACK